MQVHEIGFLGGEDGRFLRSDDCPQGSGSHHPGFLGPEEKPPHPVPTQLMRGMI
jgi:hypothetical protein